MEVTEIKTLSEYLDAMTMIKLMQHTVAQMTKASGQEDEIRKNEEQIQQMEKRLELYRRKILSFSSSYLGENLTYLLKRENMKISDLESLLNVSAGYISRTLGVDSKKRLSVDIVWQIAEVFHVNIDDLLNRNLSEPSKDLKKVISFLQKLEEETSQETIHWNNLGTAVTRYTNCLLTNGQDGKVAFAPNGEEDLFYEVKGIYSTQLNIGTVYFVILFDILEGESYRFYSAGWDENHSGIGSGSEIPYPLTLLLHSSNDVRGILKGECHKLQNSIETHENDFTVSNDARTLIDQYLNNYSSVVVDDDIPF